MGWEKRGTAGPYYYRSVRRGNRIVKQYFGSGEEGQRASREDTKRRATRAAMQLAVCTEAKRVQPIIHRTRDLTVDANLFLEAALLAAGLHRHNYGRWRTRRAK